MKEHLKKKEFGLDKVKEIVTLELVGGVMNALCFLVNCPNICRNSEIYGKLNPLEIR